MKLVELHILFDVKYGTSMSLIDLKKSKKSNKDTVNFVSRTSKNNGITAIVYKTNETPIQGNTISVSVGGSVMESFLQTEPYYTGFHIMYLTPKIELTKREMLFYCYCLRLNKFKYSYGRQANRTLNKLLIPDISEIPKWLNDLKLNDIIDIRIENVEVEKLKGDKLVEIRELFNPQNGLASNNVKRFDKKINSAYLPYVRPSNNQKTSIDAYVNKKDIPEKYIFPKETLYVSTDGQGSHTFSYVSTFDFVPNSNVTVLIPKRLMSLQEKLYYAMIITFNRFKFSYGRKPKGNRLLDLKVPEYPPEYIYTKQYFDKVLESMQL